MHVQPSGFLFSLFFANAPGRRNSLCSFMIHLLPDWRDTKIGYIKKNHGRKMAADLGLDASGWLINFNIVSKDGKPHVNRPLFTDYSE